MKKLIATLFVIIIGFVNVLISTEDAEAGYEQKYKMSYGRDCICSGSGDYWDSCHLPSPLNECSIFSCTCFDDPH